MRFRLGNERGVISGVLLILFLVMSLMLLAVYRFVVMDYLVTSDAMELKVERIRQSNMVESLRSNYVTSMRNDKTYGEMEAKEFDKAKAKDPKVVNFAEEYRNYTFDYVKKDLVDGVWVDQNKRGEFGRFIWADFKNYQSLMPPPSGIAGDVKLPYRRYEVSKNWDTTDTSGVYDKTKGTLLLPNNVILKIKFDTGVSRVRIRMGNTFEYVENDFINRTREKDEFELSGVPRTVSWIEVESDVPLGRTSISLLKAREIDVLVYKKNTIKASKKEPVLKKTLRISLGQRKMVTRYINIGSEVMK